MALRTTASFVPCTNCKGKRSVVFTIYQVELTRGIKLQTFKQKYRIFGRGINGIERKFRIWNTKERRRVSFVTSSRIEYNDAPPMSPRQKKGQENRKFLQGHTFHFSLFDASNLDWFHLSLVLMQRWRQIGRLLKGWRKFLLLLLFEIWQIWLFEKKRWDAIFGGTLFQLYLFRNFEWISFHLSFCFEDSTLSNVSYIF